MASLLAPPTTGSPSLNSTRVRFDESRDFEDSAEASHLITPAELEAQESLHAQNTNALDTSHHSQASNDGSVSAVQLAARDAVIEADLGDLEELANDIEGSTVYSLRQDTLNKWVLNIRTALTSIRNSMAYKNEKGGAIRPSPGSGKLGGASGGGGKVPRRRGSLERAIGQPATGADTSGSKRSLIPQLLVGDRTLTLGSETLRSGSDSIGVKPLNTVGGTVAGATHVLMEACATAIDADWGTCFVNNAKSEQLVLAGGVGKRAAKPGTQRIPSTVGVESHVLATGIAVNIAHAYVEEEFSAKLDKATNTRTKTQLVFPLMKPGTVSVAFGVIEFGNKLSGTSFTPDDENRVAQTAQLLSLILTRYPGDITNSNAFDPAILPKEDPKGPSILAGLNVPTNAPQTHLVYRTARVGHLKRSEVMRDAASLSYVPTITEAISHVTRVSEAWRNAVTLNMELEREVDSLQEALRVSRREVTRLQGATADLKGELSNIQVLLTSANGVIDPDAIFANRHMSLGAASDLSFLSAAPKSMKAPQPPASMNKSKRPV